MCPSDTTLSEEDTYMHKAIGVLYLMYLSHVTLTKEKKRQTHTSYGQTFIGMCRVDDDEVCGSVTMEYFFFFERKIQTGVLYLYEYDGQIKPMFNVLSFFFLCSVVLPFLLAMIIPSVFP